ICGNPCPALSSEFSSMHHLTVDEWLRVAFACHALCLTGSNCILESDLLQLGPGLSQSTIAQFLELSAGTPETLARNFRQNREDVRPEIYFFLRSPFFERPLINFGDGRLVAVEANLMGHFAEAGLYRYLRAMPGFNDTDEFASTFEAHILKNCK